MSFSEVISLQTDISYEEISKIKEALNKINSFKVEKYLLNDIPEFVYHYTSSSALLSILKRDKIRLRYTKYDCLNDKTERNNIQNVFQELLEELRIEKKYDDSFLNKLANIKIKENAFIKTQDINKNPIIKEVPEDKFICCFSENDDILGMWRYYVKNNETKGYCIGLSTNVFQENVKFRSQLKCNRIIYSDIKKKYILTEIINLLYEIKDSSFDLNEVLNNFLSEIDLYFKSTYFSDEKEIRSELSYFREEYQKNEMEIKFRDSKGSLIPYIEIEFPKSLLKSITLSPLMNEYDERNLLYFLNEMDYQNIEIRYSKLPIRF